jgi:cold shock CspA family protein
MSKGEVLHYSEKIGYCFIRPDDGDESIFVHRSSIASIGESEPLEPGDEVTYETDCT